MKFATYTTQGATYYGAVTDAGMIPLSPNFPNWPTLREVIAADG
ncbi:MAG: 2-hydroxyhepta-2,4-diene-1,7-dioate isomerase, partial [Pseudomonadota bacterium]